MNQVNTGTVHLVSGSATVRHVWGTRLVPAGVTGVFTRGDALTWAGGGAGIVSDYDAISKALELVRTAGPEPAVGTALTDTTSGATGSIGQILNGSPPRWDLQLVGHPDALAVFSPTVDIYEGSAFDRDFFTITPVWADATAYDVNYGLNTDFTPGVGLPVLVPGDIGVPASVTEAFRIIDRLLTCLCAELRFPSNGTLAASPTVLTWGSIVNDDGGWALATDEFTVPVTVTKVSVYAHITFTASAATPVLHLRKNGVVVATFENTDSESALLVLPDEVVNPGDVFDVLGSGGTATIDYTRSYFRIKAEERS